MENFENKNVGSILIPKITPDTKGRSYLERFLAGKSSWLKALAAISGFVCIFLGILGLASFGIYKKALSVKDSTISLSAAAKAQNIEEIKAGLKDSKQALWELKKSFKSINLLSFAPFIGRYIKDANHAIVALDLAFTGAEEVVGIIEPYADIIGFTKGSDQAQSGQETAQDRLDFVIKTIPDLIPKVGVLGKRMEMIRNEVNEIDYMDYPLKVSDFELRANLQRGVEAVNTAADLILQGKPLLEVSPYLLGSDSPRSYMVIFQNDKELRPTGGFITAYSIAKVERGKFEPVTSNDIYNLDNLYKPKVPAPAPIIEYIKGPYVLNKNLRLRDMNWSPDFPQAMDLFTQELKSVSIKGIDGVIAVDTQALVYLLDALGPIGVSGYGEFSTKILPQCNCPQVIYELESFADIEGPVVWSQDEPGKIIYAPANYDNRKKIIGPLMNSILANALGQSKERLPKLFEAVVKSISEKHVLFYFIDDTAQRGVAALGFAGNIKEYGEDYLHINDANLGGRKSNLYVRQEVSQEIVLEKDGSMESTLNISYKNPEKHDGWLNSVLPNWVRIYVPRGSELLQFQGVETKISPYEDLGKTVFAGFFSLRPQGVVNISLKYRLPFKAGKEFHKILIQKQPGSANSRYLLKLGKNEEEFMLDKDTEIKIKI